MSTKDATHGVEMGLRYLDENGTSVVNFDAGTTAPELRMRALEMNDKRPEAMAEPVFRHVIYEDWAPITKIERAPHPTIPFSTIYKVS